ncbi:transcription termination factor Rho [Thermodesulfobacteriota bacterium]
MEEEIKEKEIQEEEKEKKEEPKEEIRKAEADHEEKPLDKMTSIELKEVARKIPGVTGVTAMKKDQVLALIKEHRGIKEEGPAKKTKRIAPQKSESVKELKQKVIVLKVDKKSAYKEKDKKKINILRRRINRLKKRTRKVGRA